MAVGTAALTLTDAWQSLGPAPMIVQAQGGTPVLISVSGSAPGMSAPGLRIQQGGAPLSITGTGNVYARAIGVSGRIVAATLA